jgi:hypothetical protein
MQGKIVVTTGYNGWGNRKPGCEAYGPDGRWGGGVDGHLLGDHLDEIGCHEGSPFIVIAATSRYDTERLAGLKTEIVRLIGDLVHPAEVAEVGEDITVRGNDIDYGDA